MMFQLARWKQGRIESFVIQYSTWSLESPIVTRYRTPVVLVVSCHARILLSRNDPHLQESSPLATLERTPSYSAIEYNGNGLGCLFASENEIVDPRQIIQIQRKGGDPPPCNIEVFPIDQFGRSEKEVPRSSAVATRVSESP
jgi:hypothetical protein